VHTAVTAPLVFHRKRINKCDMKKFIINGQMRNYLFLIVIYLSSLVKAAMNAARECKLHKTKGLNFFFFQWPKAEQGP
jgi:hypothetical protein